MKEEAGLNAIVWTTALIAMGGGALGVVGSVSAFLAMAEMLDTHRVPSC